METDQRPQAFYVASPLRVYTLETNAEGNTNRRWHQIEAHQMILFDKLVQTEYTPMEEDSLTDDDYSYSWWLCFAKQLLNRTEYALKCILQQQQQQTCYLPCSSTDPVNLIPIGQRGSNNVNKLQAIHNLIEQFPLPVNVKLAQMPGSYAYQDFPGQIKLLGSRAEELAICASLSSTHLAAIPLSTPMKFVVAPLSSSSPQIQQILATCHIFKQSFDMQIRRILLFNDQNTASHRSRSRYPKIQEAIDQQLKSYKRSYSVEQRTNIPKDSLSAATTDEGYRSNSAAAKRRNYNRQSRAASQVGDSSFSRFMFFVSNRTVTVIRMHRPVNERPRPMKIRDTIRLFIRWQRRKNHRHHHHHRRRHFRRNHLIFPIQIAQLATILTVISLMPSNKPRLTGRFSCIPATSYFWLYHPIVDSHDLFLTKKNKHVNTATKREWKRGR